MCRAGCLECDPTSYPRQRVFTDAPIKVFPASWQDTGSGVFAFAVAAVLLTLARPQAKSSRTVTLAAVCGLAAFLVDVYLY